MASTRACRIANLLLAVVLRGESQDLDLQVATALSRAGFTGTIGSTVQARLGRPVNPKLANLGRLLFFDKIAALHSDNACAGCHSPTAVSETRNRSRSVFKTITSSARTGWARATSAYTHVVNNAFFPSLMWNGRFFAPSGNPFNKWRGFVFPLPEGTTTSPPNDAVIKTLLAAQAHVPPTELVEVAGFTGTAGTISSEFDQFDDGMGSIVPSPDGTGFRNEPIRQAVLARLNASAPYRSLFGELFPSVAAGGPIDFSMFGRAIAEFEFTLVFADAPVDRFARGERHAMSIREKQGAVLFFGKARCAGCHAVGEQSNEMFSDFQTHVIGVPQIAPLFGVSRGNMIFDGPGRDKDFGLEQITGNPADHYKFRTSPLRNVSLQSAFFHNGSFTRLEDAIGHHLNVFDSARNYPAIPAGVDKDLTQRLGPIEPVLQRLHPLLADPIALSRDEFESLVAFVRTGLLDSRAERQSLCSLVPSVLPGGMTPLRFEGCPERAR
jgi:cytochrome c peroxidase